MTDTPMEQNADAGEHPDEGTIHAWLDDALDAAAAARVAAHVRDCAECAARVAEARGLIAGASRVVAALDDVPVGTRPGWAQGAAAGTSGLDASGTKATDGLPNASLWRWMRVTPARAAIAATLLVALGITLTHQRVAEDSLKSTAATSGRMTDVVGREGGMAPDEPAPAPPQDGLLDSAVARNLAITQGKRSVQATPGPSIPQAPPPSDLSANAPSPLAGEQVAAGRAAAQAQRDTAASVADRSRVTGKIAGVPRPEAVAPTAAPAIRREGAFDERKVAAEAQSPSAGMAANALGAGAKQCFRIESTEPNATWGDQRLPVILVVDSGPPVGRRDASVLTASGGATSMRATWTRSSNDSVSIALRRIGMTGAIALGPDAGVRTGVATSGTANAVLEEMVVTSRAEAGGPGAAAQSKTSADAARRADSRKAAPSQPSAAPTPAPAPPVRQLRVSARVIACSGR
jgi:hypothetical protein